MTDRSARGDRRKFLCAAAAAGSGTLAGCLGFVGDLTSFEASPAEVAPSAVDETGYVHQHTDDVILEESIGVAGYEQDVNVRNWIAEYDRSLDEALEIDQRLAVFSVLSTPQVELFGRRFNPIDNLSPADTVELLQDQYEDVDDLERVGDDRVSMLGDGTAITRFRGVVSFDGLDIDLDIIVSDAVAVGDDFVVCVGAFPTILAGEAKNLETLIEGVVHGG